MYSRHHSEEVCYVRCGRVAVRRASPALFKVALFNSRHNSAEVCCVQCGRIAAGASARAVLQVTLPDGRSDLTNLGRCQSREVALWRATQTPVQVIPVRSRAWLGKTVYRHKKSSRQDNPSTHRFLCCSEYTSSSLTHP